MQRPSISYAVLAVAAALLAGCASPPRATVELDARGKKVWTFVDPTGVKTPVQISDIVPGSPAAALDLNVLLPTVADTAKAECEFENHPYPAGSQLCFQEDGAQVPTIHICVDGKWQDTGIECDPKGAVVEPNQD